VVEAIATDEFADWYGDLDDAGSEDIDVAVSLLEALGVTLGFPRSSAIEGATFAFGSSESSPSGARFGFSTHSTPGVRPCCSSAATRPATTAFTNEWSRSPSGFGRSTSMKLHKWSDIKRSSRDPARADRVRERVEAELLEMSLAELRRELGVTQVDMAAAAEMTQGELSKLERREDHLISTLRRCVRALGGELEITAVVGERRVKLSV
jgi:Helix-turn-helix